MGQSNNQTSIDYAVRFAQINFTVNYFRHLTHEIIIHVHRYTVRHDHHMYTFCCIYTECFFYVAPDIRPHSFSHTVSIFNCKPIFES